MIAPAESNQPPKKSHLGQNQLDLSTEWQQLCEWFKSKAAEAVSRTNSATVRAGILNTVASVCHDEPPKTLEGFKMFQRFAEAHVELWKTAPLQGSTEVPLVERTEFGRGRGNPHNNSNS